MRRILGREEIEVVKEIRAFEAIDQAIGMAGGSQRGKDGNRPKGLGQHLAR